MDTSTFKGGQDGKKRPVKKYDHFKSEVKDGIQITEYRSGSLHTMKNHTTRFPGRKIVDPKLLKKYNKGKGVELDGAGKHSYMRHKMKKKEKKIKQAEEEAARAEILLTEPSGLLEAEEDSSTTQITQKDIRAAVDITTATKSFDLKLEYGSYKMQFTRNGRHLLLGGYKGHLAAIDWVTKKLHCEINVMESIHDVCWLHTEQMYAAAQKKWVYIYDNQGIELHCIKNMERVLQLEFLPYHFLLCSGSDSGFMSWLDVTLGKEVIQFPARHGSIGVMCQNPYNAVLCCGHAKGTVTMWTPNTQEPVASILCHRYPVKAIDVDPSGRYMATAGIGNQLKIWDVRNLGETVQSYHIGYGVSKLAFSQKNLLAVAMGNVVEIFQGITKGEETRAYMQHRSDTVTDMQFCPYEDVLGISTYKGYSSLIIPGSGEPNFDALEANPYVSKQGRKEAEVKALLAKVPYNLITLDPLSIAQVDTPTLQEKIDAKKSLIHVRTPKLDFTPRYRMKGKSGSAQSYKRKQKVKEDQTREFLRDAKAQREELGLGSSKKKSKIIHQPPEILDRFKPKQK